MKSIFVLLSVVFFFAFSTMADFYVSPSGNDAANGLSETTAWKTLNHALSTVPQGTAGAPTVILAAPGTYEAESDASFWKVNFNAKDFIHLVGAGPGNTIITRGTRPWEMNGNTGIIDMNATIGSHFEGFRIAMDVYPSQWDANVIRIGNPDGVVIRDVWVDGPYTTPADRCGRRVAVYGTAGSGGLSVDHCCFSGGGLAFWLGVVGASCTVDVNHVSIVDYATTRIDDNNGFFDQRSQPNTTPVHVRNSIFSSLSLGINAGTPTNVYGFNYMVDSNIFYNVATWFNQNVWATNANTLFQPHFVTLGDGRGYVTTNTTKGWFYSVGPTGAAPTIVYPENGSDILGQAGVPLSFTVVAADPDTPASNLTFWAAGVPSGAYFNPTNQIFSWPAPSAGVYPGVTFFVSDGERAANAGISIYILGGPTLTWYVLTNGLDSAQRDGLSAPQAWKTLNYALSRVQPGNKYEHNTLQLGPGSFADERSGLHSKSQNWHVNMQAVTFIDIIGSGPESTRFVQGSNTIWELSEIFRLYACDGVSLQNFRVTVDNPTCTFISACIRIENCNDIFLNNLWLSGTKNIGQLITDGGATTNVFRNGSAVSVFGLTGQDGLRLEHLLVDGFGRAFYTEARGGYHATNLIKYCTFVEQDGSFDVDDGVALWTRASDENAEFNHIQIEKTIFANLPASITNFGLGIRVDATGDWNLYGDPIAFSLSNNYFNIVDGSPEYWFSPDLINFDASLFDVSFDPEFYTDGNGLPFAADVDYGWKPVPEPFIPLTMLLLLGMALRKS